MKWHFRSSPAFITFVISYAVFADQFLYSSIIPVLPFALHERIGLPEDESQHWVAIMFAVYGIACAATSSESTRARLSIVQQLTIAVPWALLSKRFSSHKVPFQIGLGILIGATLLLWHGRNLATQLAGRTLQGLGSAVVWITGMAALADAVGSAHIGEATGWVGIALNAGSLIAPLVGGSIFERCGYHAVYALIIAVLIVDVVLRFLMTERLHTSPDDLMSSSFSDAHAREHGEVHFRPATRDDMAEKREFNPKLTAPRIQVCDIEASAIQAAFTSLDLEATVTGKAYAVPMMLRMLCVPRVIAALWGILALAGVLSAFQTILPLQVHNTFGWNAEGGGLVFLPLTLPALLGPLVGRLTDHFGGRWFSCLAFLLMCPSLVLLRLVEDDSTAHKILLCCLLACIGLCSTLALEPLFAEITKATDEIDVTNARSSGQRQNSYLDAYALFSTAWAAGDVVGPLLAGLLLDAAGWKTTTWTLGLLAGISAAPALLYCDGPLWSS
jgi:MFS family permease